MKAAFGKNVDTSSKDKFYSEDLVSINVESENITSTGQLDVVNVNSTGVITSTRFSGLFYENSINLTKDYTITAGQNAMSVGPLSIDSRVTLTVPSSSTWTIV